MRNLIVSIAFSLSAFSLTAEPEIKGTPTDLAKYLANVPKTVQVTGESEVKVQADRAIITLKVITEDRSLENALRSNQSLRSRLTSQLVQAGVGQDAITGNKFSSTPKYGIFSDRARTYRVDNSVRITVQDEKQFQAVARLVDANPEIHYLGLDFEHSGKNDLRTKALSEASANAVARKRQYEEALGVRLTPVRFTESFQQPQTTTPRPDERAEYAKTSLPYSASDAAPAFGEMTFKAFVTVEYSVVAK
ncbi:MAG: SIMPL domain-containing protein [Limisphaerales bacterium]